MLCRRPFRQSPSCFGTLRLLSPTSIAYEEQFLLSNGVHVARSRRSPAYAFLISINLMQPTTQPPGGMRPTTQLISSDSGQQQVGGPPTSPAMHILPPPPPPPPLSPAKSDKAVAAPAPPTPPAPPARPAMAAISQEGLPLDDLDVVAQRQQFPVLNSSTTVQISTPAIKKASSGMRKFVERCIRSGVDGILAEYDTILKLTKHPQAHVAFASHKDRNRYTDVLCVDETRVKLNFPSVGGEYSDYIHANWITSASGRKLICTQGPMKSTITDFWRMVWQEKVQGILMLCNVTEDGKKKCEKYWPTPEGRTMARGPLMIRCDAVEVIEPTLTIHKLTITYEKNPAVHHRVEHCVWTGWPDQGVPKEYLPAFKLLKKLKQYNPAIIHCSAGIGRTGAITCIDLLLTKLLLGQSAFFKEVVLEARRCRRGVIQTPMQYLFIHRFLIEVALKNMIAHKEEVAAWIADYGKHYDKKEAS